ncbi:MAG: hypothetical protein RLZZ519_3 [Bacteroidota bacterium]|jgi:hypothetical protein
MFLGGFAQTHDDTPPFFATHRFVDVAQSPYLIAEVQEVKTTWHPVGV